MNRTIGTAIAVFVIVGLFTSVNLVSQEFDVSLAIKELKEEINFLKTANDSLQLQVIHLSNRVANCCGTDAGSGTGTDKDSSGTGKDSLGNDLGDGKKPLEDPTDTSTVDPGGIGDDEPIEEIPPSPCDSCGARLFENQPNPFTENTEIYFFIPEESHSAFISIYDMSGNQTMKFDVSMPKGYSSITIEGNKLQKGTYIYSLVVDGKEVDSKKMVLTEK